MTNNCDNDDDADNNNKNQIQLDEICTRTQINIFFRLRFCLFFIFHCAMHGSRFIDYNFYVAASANWDKKNIYVYSKTKFNFANVNAMSNCFGTLTICVRAWTLQQFLLNFLFIHVCTVERRVVLCRVQFCEMLISWSKRLALLIKS